MTEVTVHVDAVALLCTELRATLPALGVPGPVMSRIYTPTTTPERPARCTILRRVGGVRRNIVTDAPIITAESWALTEQVAIADAQIVRAALHGLVGQVLDQSPVYRVVEVAGPAVLPDSISEQSRATATYEVWLRGEHVVV